EHRRAPAGPRHLEAIGKQERLALVLYTLGGDVNTPWPFVNFLRAYCDELFVLVPFWAPHRSVRDAEPRAAPPERRAAAARAARLRPHPPRRAERRRHAVDPRRRGRGSVADRHPGARRVVAQPRPLEEDEPGSKGLA